MFKFLAKNIKWIISDFAVLVLLLTQTWWFKAFVPFLKLEGSLIDTRYAVKRYWNGKDEAHPAIQLLGIQSSTLALDALWPEEIAASEALQLMQKPWPW